MSKNKVTVIAEAGVNHNGSMQMAKKLIDEAAKAGADYIKFQTFIASNLVTVNAAKAEYQKKNTKGSTQYEMLKKLELSEGDHVALIKHAVKRKIKFLSTPFDEESIDVLKKLKIKTGKIPSGEITSLPYLIKMAKSFDEIILSTGMSTMKEVEEAVRVLHEAGVSRKKITLLHCTTEYPASLDNVNLKAMQSLQRKFNMPVGYSDHTKGIEIALAAVAMGATIIEKHFTLDTDLDGPDHKSSLEPAEFAMMVHCIRNIETALGSAEKKPAAVELKNRIAARKSIVALKEIVKGEVFSNNNITAKRPGNGISPMQWNKVIGKKARKNFKPDDLIEL